MDRVAQEKYANGRVTLYLDGEKALVTEDRIVLARSLRVGRRLAGGDRYHAAGQ